VQPADDTVLHRIVVERFSPTSLAYIYRYEPDLNSLELIEASGALAPEPQALARLDALMARISSLERELHFTPADLDGTGYHSGLFLPLFMADGQFLGALALFDRAVYRPEDWDAVRAAALYISLALENQRLRESRAVADTIQRATQILGDNPTPQQLVNELRQHLFGPHVSTCAMLLYGPIREDRPNGPFDYLEVRGTWSKRLGPGAGLSLRIYLEQYPDLLAELDAKEILIFPSVKQLEPRLDPLVRAFLRSERVQSMLLITLHSGPRRLGVMLIATDHPYNFKRSELRNYRMVSEFLAMSAMSQVIQQHHDFVQRGRAALLDAVTDGVMMVLPQANGPRVLTVNQAFTHLFGLSQARAQGLSLAQVLDQMQIPEDVCNDLRASWLTLPAHDTATINGEFNMILPEGVPTLMQWYSAPVYQERRVLGRIFTFHNATAERTAARLRSNFISRVSHELRTPLTSIHGFAQFILEANAGQLPDLAREYLEIIVTSSRHLNTLFSEIIEISEADIGTLHLNRQITHLPDIVINATAMLEFEYKGRGQQVLMDIDDDLPPVNVDMHRITQVLSNLLSNAIKYAPRDSKIRVTTTHIIETTQLPPGSPPDVVIPGILVTVIDEGPGLSAQEAEQVFIPFYRTKEAIKEPGSGLGLTIARSIIELHRGKLWAEPRRRGRKGGRFHFTLPTAEE
jgi:signal transduction histidine kinase